ncbi:hypothetical protein EJ05DRAFT_477044 [Pseudovirgaria hyperparasitica]|uniref:Secreted protein n=1 Tax=Pseudovirgaria hyperparasitica TaxID=470096 RepID=A0A6A6W447_9PEZI|nr:uncharacterized protein EJ05DRAFT_477044 [Pseudovirgaria hyperparasitica]KAF2756804.1 hypothetical protein EJ05DRAFT_477044 [Pseudovirgaria hyperparasitica]
MTGLTLALVGSCVFYNEACLAVSIPVVVRPHASMHDTAECDSGRFGWTPAWIARSQALIKTEVCSAMAGMRQ